MIEQQGFVDLNRSCQVIDTPYQNPPAGDMVRVRVVKRFNVSLDGGLTVTSLAPGEHEIPEWVARLAAERYGGTILGRVRA